MKLIQFKKNTLGKYILIPVYTGYTTPLWQYDMYLHFCDLY